jgi:hypothetical protein
MLFQSTLKLLFFKNSKYKKIQEKIKFVRDQIRKERSYRNDFHGYDGTISDFDKLILSSTPTFGIGSRFMCWVRANKNIMELHCQQINMYARAFAQSRNVLALPNSFFFLLEGCTLALFSLFVSALIS